MTTPVPPPPESASALAARCGVPAQHVENLRRLEAQVERLREAVRTGIKQGWDAGTWRDSARARERGEKCNRIAAELLAAAEKEPNHGT